MENKDNNVETREWQIRRYTPADAALWDDMVARSRCASFLFMRNYMDYHADRFHDCSLIAFHKGKPKCLLPANITADGVLVSHQGLTYGGWILPESGVDGSQMLSLWDAVAEWCRGAGVGEIQYKALPYIYCTHPSQEDIYALWRHGARLVETTLSSVVDLANFNGFDSMRRRHYNYALRHGVKVGPTEDFTSYWRILSDCLRERHATSPVHTLGEIEMLHRRFPDNIRLYGAYYEGEMVAGVCMYESEMVAHSQYIAAAPRGRKLHALAAIFHHLIAEVYPPQCRYFDFGISTENHGRVLNAGLHANKFGYGATGVVYQKFSLKV